MSILDRSFTPTQSLLSLNPATAMTEVNPTPLKWSSSHEMPGALVCKTQNNSPSTQPSSVNQERHNEFHPGTRLWLAFMAISVVGLMVTLDGSSISVALPVRTPITP